MKITKTPKTHAISGYRNDHSACGAIVYGSDNSAAVHSRYATCLRCRRVYGEEIPESMTVEAMVGALMALDDERRVASAERAEQAAHRAERERERLARLEEGVRESHKRLAYPAGDNSGLDLRLPSEKARDEWLRETHECRTCGGLGDSADGEPDDGGCEDCGGSGRRPGSAITAKPAPVEDLPQETKMNTPKTNTEKPFVVAPTTECRFTISTTKSEFGTVRVPTATVSGPRGTHYRELNTQLYRLAATVEALTPQGESWALDVAVQENRVKIELIDDSEREFTGAMLVLTTAAKLLGMA